MKLKYSSLLLLFFMMGCSTPSLDIVNLGNDNGICETTPKWVNQPPVEEGKVYGVGIAPPNFKGDAVQRKSAIAKAIDQIASQKHTVVNSQIASRSAVYNKSATHSMSAVSFQSVNGQNISAKIIKSCKNPNNNYFYVLMQADK